MKSLSLAGIELRRLGGERMVRAAMVVVALVPLLYGVLYLWAFWNPYGSLDKLPVALVNSDKAATVDGTTISAGEDLAAELLDRGTFGWHEVSLAEATAGLKDGRYYMALEIPQEFSANLGTANSQHPVRARLRVVNHESSNMLASQIGGRVFTEIRAAASASASHGYLEKIFVGFDDARGGLVDAAAGADTLAEGLAQARDGADALAVGSADAARGAGTLAGGLAKLRSGASAADAGARKVASGSDALSEGLSDASSGARKLRGGAEQVAGGAGELASGAEKLSAGGDSLAASADKLAAGAAQVDAGVDAALAQMATAVGGSAQVRDGAAGVDSLLKAYAAAHPEAASDPTFAQALGTAGAVKAGSASLAEGLAGAAAKGPALAGGAQQVADGSSALAAGVQQLAGGLAEASAGAKKLAGGADTVASGSRQLSAGVGTAASGSRDLAAGAGALAAGTAKLSAGTGDAATGAGSLAVGLRRLDDGAGALAAGLAPAVSGSRELASGLTAGSRDLPALSPAAQAANATMMSDPVALDVERMGEVVNYGTGFAPYFIPLALWVGALMAYFIVRPLPQRALASGASARAAAFAGFWPAAALGVVQAIILVAVLHFGLGLEPVAPGVLYAFAILSALSFIAVLQFLAAALGSAIGKLVSIALLMLQLTSAAGTFPIETVPRFFQAIHPWLPMTYVVSGMRQAISGGDMHVLALDALALVGFAAVALMGTWLTARRQQVWTMERLRPSFEL